jgi:hypothetical protein
MSAADVNDRVDLASVSVSGEPDVRVGQRVQPAGLVGFAWEQTRNGETQWGIAYRADTRGLPLRKSFRALTRPVRAQANLSSAFLVNN